MVAVRTLADLVPFEEAIAGLAVDWCDPETGRIESWDDFLARVERYLDLDLPASYDDPVLRRIVRISREAIREARA